MEDLYQKMLEYTRMTEELAFDEFTGYYQQVMDLLQKNYQDLSQEELIKAKGVLNIVYMNALSRSMKKDEYRKKFQKMAEKSKFWQEAIQARLTKEGLSAKELEEKEAALWEEQENNA